MAIKREGQSVFIRQRSPKVDNDNNYKNLLHLLGFDWAVIYHNESKGEYVQNFILRYLQTTKELTDSDGQDDGVGVATTQADISCQASFHGDPSEDSG